MSCESDNVGICVFSVNLFLEFESSEEAVIICIKERSKAETDLFCQISVGLLVKCQCFSKISFRICAALLRSITLFCNECSREYFKAAAKSSLMEIRDVDSKFELSFNKFSFSLVALPDTTSTFKFFRENFLITDNFMKGASLLCRESSVIDIHSATAKLQDFSERLSDDFLIVEICEIYS